MSNRELAEILIDQIPESKLCYVVAYLQGAAIPDETPNVETLKAMAETDEMIKAGSGQQFPGNAEEFTALLLSED